METVSEQLERVLEERAEKKAAAEEFKSSKAGNKKKKKDESSDDDEDEEEAGDLLGDDEDGIDDEGDALGPRFVPWEESSKVPECNEIKPDERCKIPDTDACGYCVRLQEGGNGMASPVFMRKPTLVAPPPLSTTTTY